ncbi:hypothetical protein CHUV0807_0838 [Cardiobacterium hominis]|uniref:Uncharacterized protein n=1 Tax=Cardiobacterium hominis TaxID=2718 RepID=A0A1C3NEM5_9GAMM|nr:hypothetical protein CHUV0807_0838 [Cardiobacterium hominis]
MIFLGVDEKGGYFSGGSSQQQTLQGGNIIYHKIRRAGGKRGAHY